MVKAAVTSRPVTWRVSAACKHKCFALLLALVGVNVQSVIVQLQFESCFLLCDSEKFCINLFWLMEHAEVNTLDLKKLIWCVLGSFAPDLYLLSVPNSSNVNINSSSELAKKQN